MSMNTARTILLFVAIYGNETLTISQNSAGEFVVSTISPEGTDSALTNWGDVVTTIAECAQEAWDGECQLRWVNSIFRDMTMSAALSGVTIK